MRRSPSLTQEQNRIHADAAYELVRAGLVEAPGARAISPWSRLEQRHQRLAGPARPRSGDAIDRGCCRLLPFRNRLRRRTSASVAEWPLRWMAGRALDTVEDRLLGLPPRRPPRRAGYMVPGGGRQGSSSRARSPWPGLAVARPPLVLAWTGRQPRREQLVPCRASGSPVDMARGCWWCTAGVQAHLVRWRRGSGAGLRWDRIGQFRD